MIIKFKEFLNENKKEEKEKLLKKQEIKYLSQKERKRLTPKQKRSLLNKRKFHGSMNDADLPSNNFVSFLEPKKED